jgi:hypothetical protein
LGKKRGPPELARALIGVKVKNLQRGTAAAVELGGKPPCASAECGMIFYCAVRNAFLCRAAMQLRVSAFKAKKIGPLE